ncbi:hypothetical protein [Elizabethkingia anophelis]|uniref:hypothetical protein n=1 Tax=Elizabethkingia anophelis TaxID=1117645 RepID=UPI00389139B2
MEELKVKILEILESYKEDFFNVDSDGWEMDRTTGVDSEHFPYIAKEIIEELEKIQDEQ